MKTDVVLLPGMHGSTALFDSFISLAPSWANCLPVALPVESTQSFSHLADQIGAKLSGLEQMLLVAESFSGPVAAHLSRQLGSKVVLLVLCNPLVYVMAPPLPGLGARLASSRLVPSAAFAWLMTGGDRVVAHAMLREVRSLPRKVLASRLAAALGVTAATYATNVSSSTLGILGTRDRLLSPRHAAAVFGVLSYATVAQLPAPHLVVQTHPAEVWAAISDEFVTAA